MKERVNQLLGSGEKMFGSLRFTRCVSGFYEEMLIRSATLETLRSLIPLNKNTLMKRVLKELNIDPKKYDPRSILGAISNAKNELLTPADYENQQGSLFEQIVGRCYALYQKGITEIINVWILMI